MKLLGDIVVLDFSQYLAGPSATLRMADLGARVIKIERPNGGDNSRRLTLKNLMADGESLNFQVINRNKESFAADFKNPEDFGMIKKLIKQADVMVENFRPGVMKRIGLDYDKVKNINPRIIYGTVTGYGSDGPWIKKPGQDLLVQSVSGLVWLNGNAGDSPTACGISLVDTATGTHLVEGVLACLLRRKKTGKGGHVEVSLFESSLDLQFESFSTQLNSGGKPVERSFYSNASAVIGAPYGIYKTSDDYIAISMGELSILAEVFEMPELLNYESMEQRDEIKKVIQEKLLTKTTDFWVKALRKRGYWCSEVNDWNKLYESAEFKAMDNIMDIRRKGADREVLTLCCPIQVNGQKIKVSRPAPRLGESNSTLINEFDLGGE